MARIAVIGAVLSVPSRSLAQDVIDQDEPPPTSVDDSLSPIQRILRTVPQRPGVFPWLKDQLKDTPTFFRDTALDVNLRSFYFDRHKFGDAESEAWAIGGAVSYRSGWLADRISAGSTFYWSQPLYAPSDKDGTLLLKTGQDEYWVVGELYSRVKLNPDNFLNLYRYGGYNTPFINRNDNRMTPNTFEGYTLTGSYGGEDGAPGIKYGAGYIDRIKERNSDNFIWMSTAAGATVKSGVIVAGALFSYGPFSIGGIDYYCPDVINIGYAESRYVLHPSERLGLLLSIQYIDQRAVGNDSLTGSYFATRQFGVKSEASYQGVILSLAYTVGANGADLQNPWGGYPGYTAVQVEDFDFASEEAFLVKAAYDWAHLGLDGVSSYALFVHGWSRTDPSTGAPASDEDEFDADLQWRPKIAMLDGLSFRTRYAVVHQYEGDKDYIHDLRVIVNYDFSLM